jgi:hypothetical protein
MKLIVHALISLVVEDSNDNPNSRLNFSSPNSSRCCFSHSSSLPGTSHQSTRELINFFLFAGSCLAGEFHGIAFVYKL